MKRRYLHAGCLAALCLLLALAFWACENPANGDDDDGPTARELAAAEFRDAHSEILEALAWRVTLSDEEAIDAALAAWEALDDEVKAELAAEKTRLDSLKALMAARRASTAELRGYLEGLPGNTKHNPYYAAYTGNESPAALYRALAAAGKYVTLDLSQSGVSGFDYDAEAGRELVVHLVLPDSLEETASTASALNAAFSGFTSLKTVRAAGPLQLGDYAFANCAALEEVTLPEATIIGASAFQDCAALTAVSLPKAASIGLSAFQGCAGLTVLDLPEAVTLDGYAFRACTGLTSVNVPRAETIGLGAVYGCTGLTAISLPAAVSTEGITFNGCTGLTSVSVPNLETVGYRAFYQCTGLAAVTLPKAASIGNTAFEGCTGLTTVTLGVTPPSIGTTIFVGAATTARTITIKVPDVAAYTAAGTPWSDKVNMTNSAAGNFWDNTSSTRARLTVALAAIE
jgi:hypothetical protein